MFLSKLQLRRLKRFYLFQLILLGVVLGLAIPSRALGGADLTTGLRFDGGSAKVTLDPAFSLANQSFTVEAWLWLDDHATDQSVLAQMGTENLLHLIVRNGRLQLGFWNDDLVGGTVLPLGQWVHVAYSYDLATRRQRVWVNGGLDGERTAFANFPENGLALHIGSYLADPSGLRGRMLELRIWDRELTAAEIGAGRFGTPVADADGLRALFTFDGIVGSDVPEAGGRLTGNVLAGEVSVVEPVLAPSRLNDPELLTPVAGGSLDPALIDYTLDPAPAAGFEDDGGRELVDGVGPLLVWGAPWFEFTGVRTAPLVRWENATPALTFTFAERVRIDAITLHAAHSGGADGVALPTTVGVRSPGGFVADFDITPSCTVGTTQALTFAELGLFTDEVTLHVQPGGTALALAEVTFDGAVLAERASEIDGLPLAAQRYFGFDPQVDDCSELRLEVTVDADEARFEFPRAADTFGVQPEVEWSADLVTWQTAPHASAAVDGWEFARLTPPPVEGRAFFRLRFSEAAPTATAPVERVAVEGDARGDAPHLFVLVGPGGPIGSPHDLDSLRVIAINDEAVAFGEAVTTAAGGTLRIFADGTGTYVAPAGLPGGQVVNETFTYTVADRLGGTVRNEFSLTLTGENDPPVVGDITAAHTATAVPAGVAYQVFEGDFSDEASFDSATAVSPGRMPTFSLDPATAPEGYGLEMTGELFVPAPGPYTFYLSGNNASVLDVGGERVVAHDPEAPAAERTGTVTLAAGSHTIRVRYFDVVEPGVLAVDYSGPGLPRTEVPASAFPRLSDILLNPLASASDPDDGDILRVSHIDGQPLDANTPVLLASGAKVELNGDGTLTYLPASGRTLLHGSNDEDSFTYTVSDSGGLTATANAFLSLARLNTAPTAVDFTFVVSNDQNGSFSAYDFASDEQGGPLLVTHINGEPLLAEVEQALPSSARVRSLSGQQGRVYYDGRGSFVRTAAAPTANDSVTVTVVDAAGASVSATGTLVVNLAADPANNLTYEDARFSPELFNVPLASTAPFSSWDAPELYDLPIPAAIRLSNPYRHTVELVVYAKHKATAVETVRSTHLLEPGGILDHTFTPVQASEPDGPNFFELHDVYVETVAGDYIHYASRPAIVPLYQKALAHYFAGMAVNPERTFEISVGDTFVNYASGRYDVARSEAQASVSLRLDGIDRLAVSPAKLPLDPTFAANIQITPECRPDNVPFDSSFFRVENLNDVSVRVIIGPVDQEVLLPPGESSFTVVFLAPITVSIQFESSLENYFLKGLAPRTSNCNLFMMTIEIIGYSPDASIILFEVTNNSTVTLQNALIKVEGSGEFLSTPFNFAPGERRAVELSGVPGPPFPPVRAFYTLGGTTFNSDLISLEDIPPL